MTEATAMTEGRRAMSEARRLYRSETSRMVAGVCGGLGEYLNVDPTVVRVVFVLLAILNGAGVLAYLAFWLLVPTQSSVGAGTRDSAREGAEELRRQVERVADRVRAVFRRPRAGDEAASRGGGAAPSQPVGTQTVTSPDARPVTGAEHAPDSGVPPPPAPPPPPAQQPPPAQEPPPVPPPAPAQPPPPARDERPGPGHDPDRGPGAT